nr:immunoglobulin heavy chain junction region [Macaca mulatta]
CTRVVLTAILATRFDVW